MRPHIPLLRFGRPYESLASSPVVDAATGEPMATLSLANPGLIRHDLRRKEEVARSLRRFTTEALIDCCKRAADLFMHGALPFGEETQGPGTYVEMLSRVSGLPHNLCRANMEKIRYVLANMAAVLGGLTRGLETFEAVDRGMADHHGGPLSYVPQANAMAVILPSNSPGVNSIWLPAPVLKTPTMLKPGREEPLTPWRIVQAMIQGGIPEEAFGFYPTDHEGSDVLVQACDRAILFGDDSSMARYAVDPCVQCHGTGRSKIVIGPDVIDDWQRYLDVIVTSLTANGGRSCINVSSVFVPKHARAIADALAERVAAIPPRALDDDDAVLSAFANPRVAEWVDQVIDRGLDIPGACDVTASWRSETRLARTGGLTFLRPTVVHCDRLDHPLANTEFMFPFCSVVEIAPDGLVHSLGPTLVATLISDDVSIQTSLLQAPGVDRINLGPMPTTQVHWDQPHEGNLFDFLYRRRAIQCTA